MSHCPAHNIPPVRTFGGKLICLKCRHEHRAALFGTPVKFTDPALNGDNKARSNAKRPEQGCPVGSGRRKEAE